MNFSFIRWGLILVTAGTSGAAYLPVAIQGGSYNADVIVESNASPQLTICTTATLDEGANNYGATVFEQGRDPNHPSNGVPPANSIFAAYDHADYAYRMATSYTGPNGLLVDGIISNGTFVLTSPGAYATLSLICLGGNGGNGINATINHADGSSESASFSVPDWFGGTAGIAWIMGGRITQTCYGNTEVDGTSGDGLGNPRLYHREFALSNTNSPVTSVQFRYASGGLSSHSAILCLSGATAGAAISPITVTGYDYDFIWEASAPQPGRIMNQTGSPATTQTMADTNNTGETWYERGYNKNNNAQTGDGTPRNNPAQDLTGTGLPPAGSLITNSTGDHVFRMPVDYTTNDAIYLSSVMTNATITLATPTAYDALSFLGAASQGPLALNYLVTHAGGTTETGVLTINDWFDSSVPYGCTANGCVAADTGFFSAVDSNLPRLLIQDLVLFDPDDPVVSIQLEDTNTAGGGCALFALSGAVGAIVGPPPPLLPESVYAGSDATFRATVWASGPLTCQWQKGTNGLFVNLSDGGNISGAASTNLIIAAAGFADQGDYRFIASDQFGNYTVSTAAALLVFSTNQDVTQPGDSISAGPNLVPFGDGSPANAIDNDMSRKFGASFTPGTVPYLVITPYAGWTTITGLRIYAGDDSTARDPSSYLLEGSLDGGSTYTLLASNAIVLGDNRNAGLAAGTAPDPLTQVVTEARFTNATGYTSYRLSFPTQKGGAGNTQIQFQELELLGVRTAGEHHPVISGLTLGGGRLSFKISNGWPNGTFSILTNSVLSAPVADWGALATGTLDGTGNAAASLPAGSPDGCLFYLIKTP